jgi:Ca2+-binding RTX toxin-like protein
VKSRSTRWLTHVAVTVGLVTAPLALTTPASQATPVYHSTLVVSGAWDSRVGPDGSYVVTGTAPTTGMATTPGAYVEPQSNGQGAFVTKYDPTGAVAWQLTIGGQLRTDGSAIAVGDDGSVYVTGSVNTPDGFPTTAGALSRDYTGSEGETFLAKFSPDGSRLVYATLLPGVFSGLDLDVDDQGLVALVGAAYVDLPTSPQALRTTPPAADESASYAVEITADGSGYRWATYLPGSDGTLALDVELGPGGEVVVGGKTRAADFTTTPGAIADLGGGYDPFISVLSANASSLIASARFGGHEKSDERITGIAVGHGAVWATGISDATDFPTTPDAWFPVKPADYRRPPMWVARLPLSLHSFAFSTYLPARGGEIHTQPDGDAVIDVGDDPPTGFPRAGDDIVSAFLYLKPDGTLDDLTRLPFSPRDFDVDRAGTVYAMSYESTSQRGATARASLPRHKAVLGRYPRCTIEGTPGDDVLRGTPGPDVICGRGGNDAINGRGSYDVLIAGRGNDALRGGRGVDVLIGGAERDRLAGGARRDLLVGGTGPDRLSGAAGPDILRGGAGRDIVKGGDGRDHCGDPQRATRFRLCENHRP